MTEAFESTDDLQARLDTLRSEHRDLDAAIAQMLQIQLQDDLLIRRLKKRKLLLKDRIRILEAMLEPDDLA
jgi:hypothetical protein